MVKNDKGQIALIYYQPIPRVMSVPAKPKPHQYAFVVQHNVSLAWVEPEDVDKIMATRVYCCGGRHANSAFREASQSAINVWNTGRY